MIVWLASYPRSGNTFFRMLLYHSYGISTYSVTNDPLFQEIGADKIVGHELLPASLEELAIDKEVYFIKTHEFPMDGSPAIYVVRDGRDVLVSYARYILSFRRKTGRFYKLRKLLGIENFRRTLKHLIVTGDQFCGRWNDHVLSWTHGREDGITFSIRYEDLIRDPDLWVKRALETFKIRSEYARKGKPPSFEILHAKWPMFFRKGKSGAWREEMPNDLHELFWKIHGDAMSAFGYSKSN